MSKKNPPKKLQPILWSCRTDLLDLERDKGYIIHQVLIYGSFEEMRWLFRTYSKKEIIKVFLTPYKNYPRHTFYFIKNYILGLKEHYLPEEAYVTSIHGSVKLRAAGNIKKA